MANSFGGKYTQVGWHGMGDGEMERWKLEYWDSYGWWRGECKKVWMDKGL